MDFLKKQEEIIDTVTTKNVDGACIWMVSWTSFNHRYPEECYSIIDSKRHAKAFLNEDDAKSFVDSLEMAAELLQCPKLHWDIKIEKQK